MSSVPRTDTSGRFGSSLLSEAIEQDLGASGETTTESQFDFGVEGASILVSGYDSVPALECRHLVVACGLKVTVTGGVATISSRYPAFAECVISAMNGSNGDLLDNAAREFYTLPFTKFRIVVRQIITSNNSYYAQWLDAGVWADLGLPLNTTTAQGIAYHGAWQDIPADALGMRVLRVQQANGDDFNVDFASIQFWDGCSGAPPSSGETLPTLGTGTIPIEEPL